MILSNSTYHLEDRAEMSEEEKKFSRTLLRLVSFNGNWVELRIPAWDSRKNVRFPNEGIPQEIEDDFYVSNYEFYANVNIKAKNEHRL